MKVLFASLLIVATPMAYADDHYEVAILAAWTAMPGAGHIGQTNAHLHLEPRIGGGLAISARLTDRTTATLTGSMALLPVLLRVPGEEDHGQVVRVAPVSLAITANVFGTERWKPYIGGGVFLPFVRRAIRPAQVSTLHIERIEQPDHGAVLLQGGVRYLLSSRWTIVGDVKYDPVWSTLEVRADEFKKTQQTNFHPLVVSTGVGIRF